MVDLQVFLVLIVKAEEKSVIVITHEHITRGKVPLLLHDWNSPNLDCILILILDLLKLFYYQMLRIFIGSWARTLKSAWLKIHCCFLINMPEGLSDISMECLCSWDWWFRAVWNFYKSSALLPSQMASFYQSVKLIKTMGLCAITRGRMEISLHGGLGNSLESRSCLFKSSVKYISHV